MEKLSQFITSLNNFKRYLLFTTIFQTIRVFLMILITKLMNSSCFILVLSIFMIIIQSLLLRDKYNKILKSKILFDVLLIFSSISHLILILFCQSQCLGSYFFDGLEIGILMFLLNNAISRSINFFIFNIIALIFFFFEKKLDSLSTTYEQLFYSLNIFFLSLFLFFCKNKDIMQKKQKIKVKPNSEKIDKAICAFSIPKNSIKSFDTIPKVSIKENLTIKEINYEQGDQILNLIKESFDIKEINYEHILNENQRGIIIFDNKYSLIYCNNYILNFFNNCEDKNLQNQILDLKENENFIPSQNEDQSIFFLDIINNLTNKIEKFTATTHDVPRKRAQIIRISTEKSIVKKRKSFCFLSGKIIKNDFVETLSLVNINSNDNSLKIIVKSSLNSLEFDQNMVRNINENAESILINLGINRRQKLRTTKDFIKNILKSNTMERKKNRFFANYKGKLILLECNINNKDYDQNQIILFFQDITQIEFIKNIEMDKKFIATICHELKTPLNSITNMIDLIKENLEKTSEDFDQYIENISINSKFLLSSINDFIDYFYLNSKQFHPNIALFNLFELISEVFQIHCVLAEKKNIELILNYDTNAPIEINNDSDRIKQIIFNLLNNAIRFTSFGSIDLKVSNHDNSHVKVSILDTGIGLSKSELKNLGNFKNVENSHSKTIGFGLFISNLLANFLGNNENFSYGINVASEKNKGSNFWFLIENIHKKEINCNAEEDFNILENDSCSIKFNKQYNKLHSFKPKFISSNQKTSIEENKIPSIVENKCVCPKILVVDDNPFNLMVCQLLLAKNNINIDESHNGQEAIDKVKYVLNDKTYFCEKCKFYKIIFMDIDMPIKNGFEATKELIEIFTIHSICIPIIAVSAFKGKEEKEMAYDVGMKEFIEKPLSQEKLEKTLEKYNFNQ